MKLQPFEKFEKKYIAGLINLGKVYFVVQTYQRGSDHFREDRTAILLTDYETREMAEGHLKAVRDDANARIIYLHDPADLNDLRFMISMDSTFDVFWAVTCSRAAIRQKVNKDYKDHVRNYIEKNTRWRIGGNDTLTVNLNTTFGELFAILKYNQEEELRVKFEELEKA